MENLESYVDSNEELEFRNNVFKSISRDLSSIVWVAIVLLMIIWSYMQTETIMTKEAKSDVYKFGFVQSNIDLK